MKKFGKLLFGLLLLLQACQTNNSSINQVSFKALESGTDVSLRGLCVVDENVVWVSGAHGTVLCTLNGGESWEVLKVPGAENNDFRSIYAWDKNRVMVFGVAGPDFGYKTEDGGKTWDVVYTDATPGLFFNSLKFADEKNGLAVSDPVDGKFFVLRTTDAGVTWERVSDLPLAEEGEANFAASNTCIEYLPSGKAWIATGGKVARVFYSEDFGISWKVAKTPMIRGMASSGIFSISFKNDLEGIIVGGVYDQPELNTNIAAYSSDGGKSWLPAKVMPNEYRSCVHQVSSDNISFAFSIGKTGSDVSFDNGINWNHLDKTGFYTSRPVPGKLEGFAAGGEGKIAKYSFGK